MSTYLLQGQPFVGFTAPGAVRLTRRGRAVFTTLFLIAALALMVAFGGNALASREAGKPIPVRTVQVQPGDTLYAIAGEVAKPGGVRDMVHRIVDLNSLSGDTLQVGDTIVVPLD